MCLDNAIQIKVPEPDSHFLLRGCPKCQSDNVAYVQYKQGAQEPWRVQCFQCGHAVDKQALFRHEAQIAWNKEERYDRNYQQSAS